MNEGEYLNIYLHMPQIMNYKPSMIINDHSEVIHNNFTPNQNTFEIELN